MGSIAHSAACRVLACAGLSLVAVWAVSLPVAAQQIFVAEQPTDRARLSGFLWRGDVNGTIVAPVAVPEASGLAGGIDVQETLGLTGASAGWVVEGDLGIRPRHRILVSFSGISHSATNEFAIPLGELVPPLNVTSQSDISIRDLHGAYNFLFVSNSWIDVGAIGGIGYFDNQVAVASEAFQVAESFESAYPLFGGNVLLKSDDLMSISAQFTGFPNVSVGAYSGSQSQLSVLFLVFPSPALGLSAGYERYQLSLEDAGSGVSIDLVWDGYVIGGQFRF